MIKWINVNDNYKVVPSGSPCRTAQPSVQDIGHVPLNGGEEKFPLTHVSKIDSKFETDTNVIEISISTKTKER